MLTDTHCHVHDSDYPDADGARERALKNDVTKILCVGTNEHDSDLAVTFAEKWPIAYAVVGVHPHNTDKGYSSIQHILNEQYERVVGIGEIGLDYYYDNSPRDVQIAALEQQLQWALDYNLPVSFHVREAFEDFWPIFDNFAGIRGVLHSFTDTESTLEKALSKGLYIGVNGISTFARDKAAMFDHIPLERMLLETDAPFLTPVPYRGRVNEPAFVRNVAEYHANRRMIDLEHLSRATSANASTLFTL